MKKFRIYWDFDAEESYLNAMAAKGWQFTSYSCFGFYHFKKAEPCERNYKVDCKDFKSRADYENYISLFEDAGWVHVSGSKNSYNQYFLPADAAAQNADIFSTRESAAARYKILYQLCLGNFAMCLMVLSSIFTAYGWNLSSFAFLTPGLWERTGLSFWSGFFFELPFVVLRGGTPFILLAFTLIYAYWGVRAQYAYHAGIKQAKVS